MERRRTVKPPERRRAELLDAGLAVFLEKGLRRATVEDVTRAAGVGKGTFYLYFDSKEALHSALRERFVEELLDHGDRALARVPAGDPAGRVEALVAAMIDYTLRRRDQLELLFHRPPGRSPQDAVARAEHEAVALLAREIERGVEAGALAVRDPATTAGLLFWAVHGALLELVHGARSRDTGRLRAGALELARRAVGPS